MNLKKLRERNGLNQTQFWSRIGLSQSAGSRLENEARDIQLPIKLLLDIAYGDSSTYNKTLRRVRQ